MTAPDSVPSQTDVAAEIRRLGRNFNPDVLKATYALFTPLQRNQR